MLDETLAVVSGVVAAVVAVVVGDDAVAAMGGSGRQGRGWDGCCRSVGRLGGVCRRFRGVRGWFRAGEGMVVVVNDDLVVVDVGVDVADGGCAVVASCDVAPSSGGRGFGTVSSRGAVCVAVSTEVVEVVWELELAVSYVV